MLQIKIPTIELYDEQKSEFITIPEQTLNLEHSLVSISKWESKWKKPYLKRGKLTVEETIDYIKCMTLNDNVDSNVYSALPREAYRQIEEYTNDSMTATWFNEQQGKKRPSSESITSEVIYYWMVTLNIPFECQYWHLNRLLTLIRVCNVKNAPSKKMSKNEILSQNKALNRARRKALHTKG